MTFRSARADLPVEALRQVVVNVLNDHQKKYDLIFGVVMPDHVHLLLQPLETGPDTYYALSDIMKGIKGTSSRRINQLLGTTGTVWQEGYFDRIVRDETELRGKVSYMMSNPVKAGLVEDSLEYPLFITPPEELNGRRPDRSVRPTDVRGIDHAKEVVCVRMRCRWKETKW